jgi:hypothetical protein
MKARPAPARFPYLNHRTVAEVWDDQLPKAPGDAIDKLIGLSIDAGIGGVQARTALPDRPCGWCGGRGWCSHRSAAA